MKVNRYRTEKRARDVLYTQRLNTQLFAHWQALWHEMKQNVNLSLCSGYILARKFREKESLCSKDKMFRDEKDHNKFKGENNKVKGGSFIRNQKLQCLKLLDF